MPPAIWQPLIKQRVSGKLATEIASVSYFRPSADSTTSSPGVDERAAGFWQSTDSSASTINTRGGVDDSRCHSPDSMIQAATSSSKRMAVCASCRKQITDPFILRVNPNLEFHANCLKCCSCERELNESCTAFVRNGQTFCRDDYLRLFGRQNCSRCQQTFDRADMVMRARNLIYHIPCFSCYSCRAPLRPGERFLIKDEELYCRPECFAASTAAVQCKPQTIMHDTQLMPCGSGIALNPWEAGEISREFKSSSSPLSVKSPEIMSSSSTPTSLCAPLMPSQFVPVNGHNRSSISSSSNNSMGSLSTKKSKKDKPSTRVRTVLSESQLRILKQMYSQNTRPDASTKDHLVETTGLSARVIRVWFQNKRCKDKKRQTAMKEAQRTMEKEQALHGVRIHGIPLVVEAASTDPNLDLTPVNIHQYRQNPGIWTATGPDVNSPEMVGMPPPPYMMMNHAPSYADMSGGDYGFASGSGYMPGPGISADYSSLSSPSCSD